MKKLLTQILTTIILFSIGFPQDFSATLNAVGGDGTDTTSANYDLTFGFNPDATDGYDEGIDSYAPPPPPPPAFDAALSWGGGRYYTQILAGDGDLSEHVYDIALAYGTDNLITVTWDSTGFSDMMTSCVLQDAFGGAFVNIDMITGVETTNPAYASWDGSVLSLFNPAVNTLKLKVTPTDYVVSIGHETMIPGLFALHQNYPNPFNPITTFHYDLPEQATVNIIIYDMLGRKIAQLVSARQETGYRSVQWDATDMYGKSVSAGIYLYQIQAGGFVQTRKMVLLK